MTTTTTAMSGAELKTRLGGLGLPPSWFGARVGVTMRTVVRWFDGADVAPEVAAEVEKLSAATLEEMRKMIGKLPDADTITLRTHRTDKTIKNWPSSWHRALTFRVMEHLQAQGKTVNIEYK